MAGPKARVIDDMKFMWDGKDYESTEDAKKAQSGYEKDKFDTRIVEEDGKIHVYTRRVVTDVQVEGSPPT